MLTNPMCKFLECHPELSEGSQVLSGTGDRDVTSCWWEPKLVPNFVA
jgi:hypothetical protein